MIASASDSPPITPHGKTNDQMSHAGNPCGGSHPRTAPTIFAVAAPSIPPAKNPGIANKQPMAYRGRAPATSVRREPARDGDDVRRLREHVILEGR